METLMASNFEIKEENKPRQGASSSTESSGGNTWKKSRKNPI